MYGAIHYYGIVVFRFVISANFKDKFILEQSVHPSLLQRKIIHFDMDAFYASIEIRDNPNLKGKPVIVGGSPNSRGVVCTASYEARKFGVRSAMACSVAYRLCPQAIFVPTNFEKYRAAAIQIRDIFSNYTDIIEPLSLDEAYLDVTSNNLGLYAIKIAKLIQEEILAKTGLTGSAGIAPNKLLAKITSDINKPHGLTVLLPERVLDFMQTLPLRKIHGIGPATNLRLAEKGFVFCRDIWPFTIDELTEKLGPNMGPWLYKRSRGIDERPVEISRERKSLGKEDTFSKDIDALNILTEKLEIISQEVAASLAKRSIRGKTITLKVKYSDFETITRSQSLPMHTNDAFVIREITKKLLLEKTEAGRRKIRLLGVSVANFE